MSNADPITRLNAALEGRYRIERELGEGGMATVYLADDLKHERKVGLKVLKPELAAVVGAERFLAEIKTTANLQHPHILPLFDSGEAEQFLFYVMPYVQGETLRQRLDREKQLGVEDALSLTLKVADALDYAHENGVVHRDIKPGNILLSHRGEPLVADFGIALAVAQAGGGRITETGLSLGTPHYMSPEQATGDRDVDPRSDVYALGCVLYEMLAGQPPHTGPTAQSILVHILTKEATPIGELRHTVPAHVAAAVAKAIEKLPADRFETAKSLGDALADPGFRWAPTASGATPAPLRGAALPSGATSARAWLRDRRSAAALLAALGFAALAARGWARPAAVPAPTVPTAAEITGLDLERTGGGWRLAISPDGRWLVAGHREAGSGPALYIRAAEATDWRRLPNTENGTNPTFSPDGQWVAFDGQGGVVKVPTAGGPALPVASGFSAHWGLDDVIVYNLDGAIHRVGASGGDPEVLLEPNDVSAARPHLLPGGRAVVFGTSTTGDALNSRIMVLDLGTGEVGELVPSGNNPRYVPTGHLLYGHGSGALMGVPFDLETLRVTGAPVALLPEMQVYGGGASQFAVSETGTLLYAGGNRAADRNLTTLVEVGMDGSEVALPLAARAFDTPRYAPDGGKIAYADRRAGGEVRVYDVRTGADPQFASGMYPVWSRSGEHLYFTENPGPNTGDGRRRPADGREEPTRLWDLPGGQFVLDAIPGDSILVVRDESRGNADLVLARPGGEAFEFGPFLGAEWRERNGAISPDGRWLAYQSDESGEDRVFVHSFPVITGRRSVSPGPGAEPVWSPDGRTLYYRAGSRFMAVRIETEPGFRVVSPPEVLFDRPEYARFQGPGGVRTWDIHPDGSRFVMVRSDGEGTDGVSAPAPVYVFVNWFEELCERMGDC